MIIAILMWRLVLPGLLLLGCGGVRSAGLAMTPPADGASAGSGQEEISGMDASGDAVSPLDVLAADTPSPDAGVDAVVPADQMTASGQDATSITLDAMVDLTTPAPLASCPDDQTLACGPRKERFPWSCLGMLCDAELHLPAACMAFSPFLGCACDMPPDISVPTRCFAGGGDAGASTYSVRAQAGVACRTTEDCGDRLTDVIVCGPKGTCVRSNGGRCGSGEDCVSGFCNLVENTCGGAKGEACTSNKQCASYICKDGQCK